MKQHVTNLGTGVKDKRNTSRNDLRDTIYRAEDNELQKARAEKAKKAYVTAYARMMKALQDAGKALPLVTEMDDAVKEKYAAILDGGVE